MGKKKIVARYKDSVIFLGRRPYEKMPSFVKRADVLVIPRRDIIINYTTPRKLGEYLASGRAIVATDVGDQRKILEENKCGIVTEANPQSFAKGLVRILEDDKLRRGIGENSRRLACKLFNWNLTVKKLLFIYNRVKRSH